MKTDPVDYKDVVLEKYPDAEAQEYNHGWAIVKPAPERWFWYHISNFHGNCDDAWRDAAEKVRS